MKMCNKPKLIRNNESFLFSKWGVNYGKYRNNYYVQLVYFWDICSEVYNKPEKTSHGFNYYLIMRLLFMPYMASKIIIAITIGMLYMFLLEKDIELIEQHNMYEFQPYVGLINLSCKGWIFLWLIGLI